MSGLPSCVAPLSLQLGQTVAIRCGCWSTSRCGTALPHVMPRGTAPCPPPLSPMIVVTVTPINAWAGIGTAEDDLRTVEMFFATPNHVSFQCGHYGVQPLSLTSQKWLTWKKQLLRLHLLQQEKTIKKYKHIKTVNPNPLKSKKNLQMWQWHNRHIPCEPAYRQHSCEPKFEALVAWSLGPVDFNHVQSYCIPVLRNLVCLKSL